MTESILEHPDPITTGEPDPADAEEVLSRLHNRLKQSRWLPSFAGNGWPERVRSTAVLFLGLTAAAGLALVAIFAQLNFPMLSPLPLRSGPSEGGGVARAVALDREGALALAPARPSPLTLTARGNGPAGDVSTRNEHGDRAVGAVGGPTPVPAPEETGGSVGGVPPAAPPADPAPAPAPSWTAESAPTPPTPAATPAPSPESSSKGDKKPAKSKPAKAKPAKPSRPSKPTKDDAKAEEKDEKADAMPKDEESKTPGPKYEPAPEPEPKAPTPSPDDSGKDHGNGKALGHYK